MAYELISSLEQLEEYCQQDSPDGYYGADSEASSLNTRIAQIAGISLSFAAGEGIYAPLGHAVGNNLPKEGVARIIKAQLVDRGLIAVFHNAKYDLNVIQANTGLVFPPGLYEDSIELLYLDDPDRKSKGLKDVAKTDFNVDLEKFDELFTPEERKLGLLDIRSKSPVRCLDYACADADFALRIHRKYRATREQFAFANQIDNLLINVVRKIEHNGGLQINREYIEEQMIALEKREQALKDIIHRLVGYQFEINSPKQLGQALFGKLGIPSPGQTRGKNSIHKTDAEELEKLAKVYPICEYVVSYRKVSKARSSYFQKLRTLHESGIPVRFSFNMFAAPTFRFAAPGGSPEKDGMTGINIQAVSNGEARDLLAVRLKEQTSEEDYTKQVDDDDLFSGANLNLREEGLPDGLFNYRDIDLNGLDWTALTEEDELVCIRETCTGCAANCKARGIDITRRMTKNVALIPSVRKAFRAPPGFQMVSFDYDRQELVIGANMSGERNWITALKNGEDLHEKSAANAFGQPLDHFRRLPKDEYKRKRGVGKVLNFATFYGATAYTLAKKAGISQAMAEQIYDGFKRTHPQLFAWMEKVKLFARREGYTTTYFGRRRWLKQFYAYKDRKWDAFADRSAVNTSIQGTGAEVTRIAMVKVDKAFEKNNVTKKEARFVMQLHDELSFLIRNDLLTEICPIIEKAMAFEVKKWEVQLTCGPKIGTVWGSQIDMRGKDDVAKFQESLLKAI